MEETLNKKQIAFCYEYLIDHNQTKSAIRAGYSENSARQIASRLMSKDNIQLKIEEIQTKQYENIEVTAQRIIKELSYSAFFDPKTMYDDEGNLLPIHLMPEGTRRAIAGITSTESKGKIDLTNEKTISVFDEATLKELKKPTITTHIKLIDKPKNLELLGRNIAMFIDRVKIEDDRREYTGDDPEQYVADEISKNDK